MLERKRKESAETHLVAKLRQGRPGLGHVGMMTFYKSHKCQPCNDTTEENRDKGFVLAWH